MFMVAALWIATMSALFSSPKLAISMNLWGATLKWQEFDAER